MSLSMPSAPGVLLKAFDYQCLFTWMQVVQLRDEDIARVSFEVPDAGNVDDVFVEKTDGSGTYHQVKYAVDLSNPLTHESMIEASAPGRSLLKKFYDSYVALSAANGEPPTMVLETNRPISPDDDLLVHIDSRSGTLTPRISGPGPKSKIGKARKTWLDHLDVSQDKLLAMLDHLVFRAHRESYAHMVEQCGVLMRAVGLRGDEKAVEAGVATIRRLITEGVRSLDAAALDAIVVDLELLAVVPRAALLVQAIDHRPAPELATASVDWVDLFEGDEPSARRALRDPADWNGRLRPELQAAAAKIRASGHNTVMIEGALRLSTWFLAGKELSGVAGFSVAHNARGTEWASRRTSERMPVTATPHSVDAGQDLAVGLSVSGDLTGDVLQYVAQAELPVETLLEIRPEAGVGHDSLTPDNAPEWVEAVLAKIKSARRPHHSRVHLFIFGPGPAALLLGHAWNRLPAVQLYDDLNSAELYTPTFYVPG